MSRDDFKRAIESASQSQKEYFEVTTAAQRGEQLREWFNLITSNAADCMANEPRNCYTPPGHTSSIPLIIYRWSSGDDHLCRKRQDIQGSRGRSSLCGRIRLVVCRGSAARIWRHHTVVLEEHVGHDPETTRRYLRDYYAVSSTSDRRTTCLLRND